MQLIIRTPSNCLRLSIKESSHGTLLDFSVDYFYLIFIRNSDRRSRKDEDDYNESDRLLDDDSGPDEDVENTSTRKEEKKPSLRKTLGSLFGFKFALAVFCKLLHDLLIFIQPQLLKYSVPFHLICQTNVINLDSESKVVKVDGWFLHNPLFLFSKCSALFFGFPEHFPLYLVMLEKALSVTSLTQKN